MMKLRNLMQVACMATAALTAFSCSQEEFENSGRKGNITVNATFEGAGTDTRTTVNDEYKILWQDTDALGLFCSNAESNYSNTKLEYASGAGQTSATFNGSKPSGENGCILHLSLPTKHERKRQYIDHDSTCHAYKL